MSPDDPPLAAAAPCTKSLGSDSLVSRLSHLRGVRWRIYLCNFPSSSIPDLRHCTADSRRRYAALRRRLLVDSHIPKEESTSPNIVMDNPLSENPDSMWGRFFRNAELEKQLDQDLSRLYPEHGSYFQTLGCQSMLRRILLLWCLGHPEHGYRQGMHELLAPLLYVIHADVQSLAEARALHQEHFTDKFDDALSQQNDLLYSFDFTRSCDFMEDDANFQEKTNKIVNLDELDLEIQTIVLLSDPYGAEGELGVVLSEKFMEHDVYCMFDALMSGRGGAVAMAEFFSPSTTLGTQTGLSPVIDASSALYHLLSVVDPSLHTHLIELGVEPQYFALRWLRVLFGREFMLEGLLRIWDEIFSFDNVKLATAVEDEPVLFLGVLNSRRGALICAMAVSMVLNLRSSLLALETATSCLQRLLNFPVNVDLGKMIDEAKSLLPLALDVNTEYSYAASRSHDLMKKSDVRGHSLSFNSAPSTVSLISAPERYWEEKWRDIHKKGLQKDKCPDKQRSMPKRDWTEKIKSRVYRTECDAPISPSKKEGKEEHQSSARRCLLEDLSKQLEENIEDVRDNVSLNQRDLSQDRFVARLGDIKNDGGIETTIAGPSTTSYDNSTDHPDPGSPVRGSGSAENDLEKSSVDSYVSRDMNEESQQIGPSCYVSQGQPTDSHPSDSSLSPHISDSPELAANLSYSEDRKSFSGKFQWLWKIGHHASHEEATDNVPEVIKITNEECQRSTTVVESAEEHNGINLKGKVKEQNLIRNLRNLGQSMLDNIQVIESAFSQDKRQASSLDNLSKNALVEKGQVTAMSALKELRKISNLLSEM